MKICFVAPAAGPVIQSHSARVVGGTEVRAWVFARELGRTDDVSFAAIGRGEPGPVSGVRILWLDDVQRPAGLIARTRWKLDQIRGRPFDPILNASSDVTVFFGASSFNAGVLRRLKRRGLKSVLFAGSDSDFSEDYVSPVPGVRNRYGSFLSDCGDLIRGADLILCQTETQRRLVRERFGRESERVPNPFQASRAESSQEPGAFLWVGKSDGVKRPEIVLRLARQNPGLRFEMVMNRSDEDLHSRILRELPPNVRLDEWVPPASMGDRFASCAALINTSDFEGFPNTFLEAGVNGRAVLSLNVDPDGALQRVLGMGCAGGDVPKLEAWVRELGRDPEKARVLGLRWREYVRAEHDPVRCTERLRVALARLASGGVG